MYTFLLQDRIVKFDGEKPDLPSTLLIQAKLGPPGIFWHGDRVSHLFAPDNYVHIVFNANTGRTIAFLKESMEFPCVVSELPNMRITLQSNLLRFETNLYSYEQLAGYLIDINHVIPSILSIILEDPPIVEEITGELGAVPFQVEHLHIEDHFQVSTLEELEHNIREAFSHWNSLSSNRLVAATHYVHIASRLKRVGVSPWEFMAEIVLNLCKALHILFGTGRSDVRNGLAKLGYTSEEIENGFIPIMILRDSLDVAHPRIALPRQVQLQILYTYLVQSESRFRELIRRILRHLSEENLEFGKRDDIHFDPDEQRKFDVLINNIQKSIVAF